MVRRVNVVSKVWFTVGGGDSEHMYMNSVLVCIQHKEGLYICLYTSPPKSTFSNNMVSHIHCVPRD